MPGYVLHCTVCKISVETRAGWLLHLLQDRHQSAAAQEVGKWGVGMRKCALVVYSSFQVSIEPGGGGGGGGGGGLAVLEHFSTRSASARSGSLVSDFIGIPALPNVAVVQLESKRKVKDIFETAPGSQIEINGQIVQLRKADDYLELEWQALLSQLNLDKKLHENGDSGGGGGGGLSKTKKRKSKTSLDQDDNEESASCSKIKRASKSVPVPARESNMEHDGLLGTHPPSPPPASNTNLLRSQYESLADQVTIPEQPQWEFALQLIQKLEELASGEWPRCRVYMFRNWYLKLRNVAGDKLFLYFDVEGRLAGTGSNKDSREDFRKLARILSSHKAMLERELGLKMSRVGDRDPKNTTTLDFVCSKPEFGHQNAITICVRLHPFYLVQVQTCRLLEYMTRFDPRVGPLITLVFYWTIVSQVRLARGPIDDIDFTPEPGAMEWLIMCYLCHPSNNKMVPTPREILEKGSTTCSPGRPVVMKNNEDIGFAIDNDFVRSWRQSHNAPDENSEDFLLNVLQMAEGFFTFYANLSTGSWILNPKDGEIIGVKELMEMDQVPGASSKLSASEMRILKSISKLESVSADGQDYVLLAHPLYFKQKLAFQYKEFSKRVLPAMKKGAERLQKFLSNSTYREEMLSNDSKGLKALFTN